jgi:hypothetical protein
MFENLAVRDAKIYAEAIGAKVFHCRDETGLEADIVVEKKDGTWGAFEVKLGESDADTAADSLIALRKKIERLGGRPPHFWPLCAAYAVFLIPAMTG